MAYARVWIPDVRVWCEKCEKEIGYESLSPDTYDGHEPCWFLVVKCHGGSRGVYLPVYEDEDEDELTEARVVVFHEGRRASKRVPSGFDAGAPIVPEDFKGAYVSY